MHNIISNKQQDGPKIVLVAIVRPLFVDRTDTPINMLVSYSLVLNASAIARLHRRAKVQNCQGHGSGSLPSQHTRVQRVQEPLM